MYLGLLIEHEKVVPSRFRAQDTLSMIDQPVHLRTCCQNFPKGSIKYCGDHTTINSRHIYTRDEPTCLSCVTAGEFGTNLLIVYQPLLQAANDTSSISERSVSPAPLSFDSTTYLLRDLGSIVCNDSRKVERGSRIKAGDISPARRYK